MAATGLLALVVWFGGAYLTTVLTGNESIGFVLAAGVFSIPLAVPTSFVVGLLLWRKAYPETSRVSHGALFGAATALASLTVGSVGPVLFLSVSNLLRGTMAVTEAATFFALFLPISFGLAVVAAGWVIVPIGAFGGWYHERAKTVA
ncbi:hypothetical protein C440_02763 [Haloferax mucosum ATCC BAA-1512]|uniref:Uncharacterized protein n=1 Tax=Haloferax mucosum ATCC BAA-1512 TaxID=662479 RepID=M0IRN9_9EURY|nr:hypothetical protein C440_02763 [Haloferax mucosum ATCC BAA-1512]